MDGAGCRIGSSTGAKVGPGAGKLDVLEVGLRPGVGAGVRVVTGRKAAFEFGLKRRYGPVLELG